MSVIRGIKRRFAMSFPRVALGLRRLRSATYLRYFALFPNLASAVREFRQEAHKPHRSGFGMNLLGPRYLIEPGLEAKEMALIEEKLKQVDVFVDVGANVGLYTCLAASKGRSVVAIEPLASNLRFLYQNVQNSDVKGVEVFPIGLSSSPGLGNLGGIGAQASFLPNWATEGWGFNKYVHTVCPMSTLDIVLGNRFSGRQILVKIDVEGFEFDVLMGATATLEMSPKPVWIVECFLNEFHPGGMNPHFLEVFSIFWDRGYRATVASTDGVPVTRETVSEWIMRGMVEGKVYNFCFEHSLTDPS